MPKEGHELFGRVSFKAKVRTVNVQRAQEKDETNNHCPIHHTLQVKYCPITEPCH